jgi:hypothetical protein
VTVQGLAATVIPHRRPRVRVRRRFLHVAQRDTGIQGGGDEGVAQSVRSDPLGDPCPAGDPPHDPAGGVTVQPVTVGAEEHWAHGALADREVNGAGDARGERHGDGLAAFAQHRQCPVTAFEAEVVDIDADRLRDPQPVEGEEGHQRVIAGRRQASGDEDGADLVAVQTTT